MKGAVTANDPAVFRPVSPVAPAMVVIQDRTDATLGDGLVAARSREDDLLHFSLLHEDELAFQKPACERRTELGGIGFRIRHQT